MECNVFTEFRQYALIAQLTKQIGSENKVMGKTALQKLVFILQEKYNVPCGYDFRLYTYGPYSSTLAADLNTVESLSGVVIDENEVGFGYTISPGKKADLLINQEQTFIEEHQDSITKLIEQFGNYSARELELRATMIYVDKDLPREPKEGFIDTVNEIKSQFERSAVETAYQELCEKELIGRRN